MAKPVVIIAPGSFSPASEYDALITHLNSSGYEAIAYNLPSASKKPGNQYEQASTLAEDGMFFNGVCSALCDQSQNVVIMVRTSGETHGRCTSLLSPAETFHRAILTAAWSSRKPSRI